MSLKMEFIFNWKTRTNFKISRADAESRHPEPEDFAHQKFYNFIRATFGQPNVQYATPNFEKLRQFARGAHPIWTIFNKTSKTYMVGPIFDKQLLNHLVPKLFTTNCKIILILPQFRHQLYWRKLVCQTKLHKIPLHLYSKNNRPYPIRFPLFAAFLTAHKK